MGRRRRPRSSRSASPVAGSMSSTPFASATATCGSDVDRQPGEPPVVDRLLDVRRAGRRPAIRRDDRSDRRWPRQALLVGRGRGRRRSPAIARAAAAGSLTAPGAPTRVGRGAGRARCRWRLSSWTVPRTSAEIASSVTSRSSAVTRPRPSRRRRDEQPLDRAVDLAERDGVGGVAAEPVAADRVERADVDGRDRAVAAADEQPVPGRSRRRRPRRRGSGSSRRAPGSRGRRSAAPSR